MITDKMVEAVRDACEGCGCDECYEKVRAALTAALAVEQEAVAYVHSDKGTFITPKHYSILVSSRDKYLPLYAAPVAAPMREAAQTIAALRAERDEAQQATRLQEAACDEYAERTKAAEAEVKELEAEISNLDAELDHWSQLAVDDLGKNPPTSWKEIAATAIRERDELRKALVPFANAIVGLQTVWDDDLTLGFSNPLTQRVTVGDFRRARSASSNREGGEE